MAFTQSDLDAVERAIASGELSITNEGGRKVDYRSIAELMRARDMIRADLAKASQSRQPSFGGRGYSLARFDN